jgi:pimeloyl-ACP methyl ester carboxylesterase
MLGQAMKIQVRDQRLFFDIEGPEFVLKDGKLEQLPTLILLHGAPGNSDHSVFKPAFSALREVCRIVYLDIAGAGRSDAPPDDNFSLERWADDLVEFCRLLSIEKPIVLGVSGGGFIAMVYGYRHPDHAGGLILASTQAKLDVERSIAEFERLGGPEAEVAARDFLTDRVDAKTSKAFGEKCMPVYNTTPQPARDSIIFRSKLAMVFHSPGGIWHTMDLRSEIVTNASAYRRSRPCDAATRFVRHCRLFIPKRHATRNHSGHRTWTVARQTGRDLRALNEIHHFGC